MCGEVVKHLEYPCRKIQEQQEILQQHRKILSIGYFLDNLMIDVIFSVLLKCWPSSKGHKQ